MTADLRLMYDWVKRTRETVFTWTEALPPDVYTLERSDFAHGSIRNVQVHVLACYRHWVAECGLDLQRPPASTVQDAAAVRDAFREVDGWLNLAFERFSDVDAPVVVQSGDFGALRVTPRWLVVHPITHEFHHKGQMLALGRFLGHPHPPGSDTDLVWPI